MKVEYGLEQATNFHPALIIVSAKHVGAMLVIAL